MRRKEEKMRDRRGKMIKKEIRKGKSRRKK